MKNFTTQEIRDLLNRVIMDEVSFTRMVEIMNERMSERVSERVEEPRFKEGDFVKDAIDGAICIYHDTNESGGIVSHAGCHNWYTTTKTEIGWGYTKDFRFATESEKQELLDALAKEGKRWNAEKLCVEDIPEEPKKGDLAIFWDFNKEGASIGKYNQFIMNVSFPHRDHREIVWKNAIKFESKEQYERFIKGEI